VVTAVAADCLIVWPRPSSTVAGPAPALLRLLALGSVMIASAEGLGTIETVVSTPVSLDHIGVSLMGLYALGCTG